MATSAKQELPPISPAEVESPIINSPFVEPQFHWQIERGKPPVKAAGRRRAGYFYRVPEHAGRGRKNKSTPDMFEAEKGEQVDLTIVNEIRTRVKDWRKGIRSSGLAYDGASSVTKELLELWRSEDRMQRLFFAQIEAVETILFLIEASEIYRKGLPDIPKDEPGLDTRAAGFRAFVRSHRNDKRPDNCYCEWFHQGILQFEFFRPLHLIPAIRDAARPLRQWLDLAA